MGPCDVEKIAGMVRRNNRQAAKARIRAEARTAGEGVRSGAESDAQEKNKRSCAARVRFLVMREHSRFAYEPRLDEFDSGYLPGSNGVESAC